MIAVDLSGHAGKCKRRAVNLLYGLCDWKFGSKGGRLTPNTCPRTAA